jgi:lipopolysaccharide/colanic/teichoic acid biosynthesis glycosyltransferase
MNLEIIHKTVPRYKYVRVTERSASDAASSDTFLYLGTADKVFDALVLNMGKGLHLRTLSEITETLTFLKEYGTYLPQAIFLDIPYQKDKFMSIRRFIANDVDLKGLVLIGNVRKLSSSENEDIISSHLVDEIMDFDSELAMAATRVGFLNRMKCSAAVEDSAVKIETAGSMEIGAVGIYKRTFDIIFSFTLLLILLPVMMVIAIAIKWESKGPVFYNSFRAGRGFQIFRFFKFRTMKVGADRMIQSMTHLNKYNTSNGAVFFKIKNDPRITGVGKFLRATGLDELPQLFNVLRGDMSIVGNRPLPLYEANTLTTDEWAERFAAPAGITGFWQVQEKMNAVLSSEDRIKADIHYSRSHNLKMDLQIMLRTIPFLVSEFPNQEKAKPETRNTVVSKFNTEFSI